MFSSIFQGEEKSGFWFQKNDILLLLKETININPFRGIEKYGFILLYESLKHLFPESCTPSTFQNKLRLEMNNYKINKDENIQRYFFYIFVLHALAFIEKHS